ncbi:MAG: urease subunit beta [Actinobacteria bacterium]|nr:urease subunit beta [Actinomycetota bacterium]
MRPGEVIPGDGPVPAAVATRRVAVRIRNDGRFPASLGSHLPLSWTSAALAIDPPRDELEGARLDLPAGATLRIEPGAEVDAEAIWTR